MGYAITTVSVRDARAGQVDREWLERAYRDYLDDLAPLGGGLFPALAEIGHREPDQLARWFGDPCALPFLIVKTGRPVGFAMVLRIAATLCEPRACYRMAEFFVARASRGLGIGRIAAELIFNRFAGRWEIIEYARHPRAVQFWRGVLAAYMPGAVEERSVDGEIRQTFDSRRALAPSGGAHALPN